MRLRRLQSAQTDVGEQQTAARWLWFLREGRRCPPVHAGAKSKTGWKQNARNATLRALIQQNWVEMTGWCNIHSRIGGLGVCNSCGVRARHPRVRRVPPTRTAPPSKYGCGNRLGAGIHGGISLDRYSEHLDVSSS